MKLFLGVCALLMSSCVTTYYSNDGMVDALRKITPKEDTICRDESYDWFKRKKGIHIHCVDDTLNTK